MFETGWRGILRCTDWHRHAWLVHGFSSRATGDFLVWPGEEAVASAFGVHGFGMATLSQVHSERCVRADSPWGAKRPEADAVVTNRPGMLVGVRTADCLPVLLMDPVTRSVAAIHAGWRGAAAGVLPNAVTALCAEYGGRTGDIRAAIGPGIGVCCFEVGEEVASRFAESHVDRSRDRPHVDLASALIQQLDAAGVSAVSSCGECTSCALDRYYSHRAEGGDTGRMLAVVGVAPESSR